MEQEQEVKEEKSLEEQERDRKRVLIIVLILLFIAIIALAIAFLKITGELGGEIINPPEPPIIPKAEWKVGFVSKEAEGISSGNTVNRGSCGVITSTETSATISNVKLAATNSRCSYPLTIENNGTLDAKVSEIVLAPPTGINCNIKESEMVCGNIRYRVAIDSLGKELLKKDKELKIKEQVLAYLVVETVNNNTSFNEITQSGAKITIIYAEA